MVAGAASPASPVASVSHRQRLPPRPTSAAALWPPAAAAPPQPRSPADCCCFTCSASSPLPCSPACQPAPPAPHLVHPLELASAAASHGAPTSHPRRPPLAGPRPLAPHCPSPATTGPSRAPPSAGSAPTGAHSPARARYLPAPLGL
nr:vegetative cell wall protein gp1-like [Aegilops tauschii subsp. strangulata]